MLQIPQKTLENAMIALIGLDMGEGVDEVHEAVLTLLHWEHRQREKDARGPPGGKATLVEANAKEAAKTNAPVGVPHGSPRNLLATRPKGPIPAGYAPVVRDAAVQTDDPVLPPVPTWEELRAGLERARSLDQAANRVRTEAFETLERYAGMAAEPHPEAAYWRKPAVAKAEETEHLIAWRAERRARLLREREDEEGKFRATSEKALGEARARRRAEEAELQAVRARCEEARRDKERAAADLGLAQPRPPTQPQVPPGPPTQPQVPPGPPTQPQVPPGAGRPRFCFVCQWPGVRVPRRCPNVAAYPPRADAPPVDNQGKA